MYSSNHYIDRAWATDLAHIQEGPY